VGVGGAGEVVGEVDGPGCNTDNHGAYQANQQNQTLLHLLPLSVCD